MNTITNTGIRNLGLALATLLALAIFVAAAPQAQAADLLDFGYDTYDFGGGYDYGYDTYDFGGGYDYGYDTYDFGNDYGYDTYDYGYGSSPFSGGGFGGGGWSMPFSMPPTGGNFQTQNQNQAQSQSQSSNNTNVNNNVNNVNVTVPQAQPTIVYQQQPVYQQPTTYDICPNLPGIQSTLPQGYSIQNGYCQTYQPVYPTPAPQPYVTLSQVPYTGLELGPVGTALYWGFLVLWCLMAAYLIAVKKVHYKLASWFAGSESVTVAHAPRVAHIAHAPAPTVASSGIDSFIQSQINRAK